MVLEAPYFCEEVRKLLSKNYGDNALYEVGLRVFTTINSKMQEGADIILKKHLLKLRLWLILVY